MDKIAVLIPCYNESQTIAKVVSDFKKSLPEAKIYVYDNCSTDHTDLIEAVLSLPEKYKDVIYLYYYEGYSAAEISSILNKKVNTVYTLLTRARQLLKNKLEGVIDDE